jgi:hypothetical protein
MAELDGTQAPPAAQGLLDDQIVLSDVIVVSVVVKNAPGPDGSGAPWPVREVGKSRG